MIPCRTAAIALLLSMVCLIPCARAQGGQQPPPFTAPVAPMPGVNQAPGQQAVPEHQERSIQPDAPLPQADRSTVDLRNLPPMAPQPALPAQPADGVRKIEVAKAQANAEAPSHLNTHWFSLIGPYKSPRTPELLTAPANRLAGLLRDGRLYLSVHDAVELAIENNLDVEISRYNLLLADSDLTRAHGGGTLRGIDYTVQETPPGVSATTSPLLITATTGNAASTNAAVTDLSQVTQIGSGTTQNLSQDNTATYAPGPAIPFYDPTVSGQAGYLHRSNQISLESTSSGSTGTTPTGTLDYVYTGVDFQEGFSTGTQLDAYVDNAAQVLFASNSQDNPFHAPSTSATLTQPLLRGWGRQVNLRFIHIAQIDQKASRLLFEQQLLETVYGISRLYYDLVSLGENIGVKQEALAAAQKLYSDDRSQVEQGTLAPIELIRVQALVSSSRLDLIQAESEYRQQESILREQLLRRLGDIGSSVTLIVPTDHILVPEHPEPMDVKALTGDALANRPDLAQAALQVKADELSVNASRNNVRPQLNLYGNVETRGSSLVPMEQVGSPGTGMVTPPPALSQGGFRLSTIYQGGIQLGLPLRNRIAQADAARDEIQLRRAQGRTEKLENDIRQQIESSSIALENAQEAYAAAVESRNYQQQLLQAEQDKFSVGESTNFLIVQDEAFLAQARSTEVAARSDWMKARMSLDRALGNLLEKNGISLDEAVQGKLQK